MASENSKMRNSDMPPAPRRSHSSSRQKLTQKLDRTPGMRLFHEEEQGPDIVVHRTASATRNFFGSLSGLRQLGSKSSRSWLIRDASLPADMNGLDTESNASSFGSISAFGSRFGSAVDLPPLVGLEDLEVSGAPCETGLQSSHSIFRRSQLETGSQQNLSDIGTPGPYYGNELSYSHRDDNIAMERFDLDGFVASRNVPYEPSNRITDVEGANSKMLEKQKQECAATRIQSAFRASRVRARVRAMHVAVVTIQRLFRGYRARTSYREKLERVLRLQALDRSVRIRKQYRKIYNAVIISHELWLAAKRRKFMEQQVAATKIQSCYRGWSARKVCNKMYRVIILLQACERRRQAQTRYQKLVNIVLSLQRTRRSTILRRGKVQAAEELKSLQELRRLQEWAAVRIQSACRGWVAREIYKKKIVCVVKLQAFVRRLRLLKSFHRLRNAVGLIQGAWRLHRLRLQTENRHKSAVRIQKTFRGWTARRDFRREVTAAVVMQSWVRRKLQLSDYQNLRAATLKIQRAWRSHHLHCVQLRRDQDFAAIRIQAYYKGHVARKLYIAQVARLAKLQACVRRKHCVVAYRQTCLAVLSIQKAWRAYVSDQVQRQNVLKEQAAIRIQSMYRGHLCRKVYWSDLNKVVQVQAYIRRQQAQKRYRQLQKVVVSSQKIWRAARSQRLLSQLQERAALLIQSLFRGWSVRKEVQLDLDRVVFLQACARRKIARKHYQMLLGAACTIQRTWRASKCRRCHLQWELETSAALKIQSCYRGWMCRKGFKMDVARVVYIQACARRTLGQKHYEELRYIVNSLQRRWRNIKQLQLEEEIYAALKIQSWWRRHQQHMLHLSALQMRVDHVTKIQRRWRGRKILESLRPERRFKEQAVTCIQAHFRGKRVRRWLQKRKQAVVCIESAYWSYAQRRRCTEVMLSEQSCHVSEQTAGILQTYDSESLLVDSENLLDNSLREEVRPGSTGNLSTVFAENPLRNGEYLGASLFSSCSEADGSDCGHLSAPSLVPVKDDWNEVAIDELDQCLDTCLASIPLSAATSRQLSLASSRQLSLSFDAESSSSSTDHLDAAAMSGVLTTALIESTAELDSPEKNEVVQDRVTSGGDHGNTASEAMQSRSEGEAIRFKANPGLQQLPNGEESASRMNQERKNQSKTLSKDEERLQNFAQIFLTMRHISIQQQRAQSAPPFPPSLTPLCSQTYPQSAPVAIAAPASEVCRTQRGEHCCVNVGSAIIHLPPTPASSSDQPRVLSQGTDVVLNMEELLRTLEQYCEEDTAVCGVVTEGDVGRGQGWRVQKTGLNMTSSSKLGIKQLRFPDVNAVLIVLVAMVVYTRTICREVFFWDKAFTS